jgi:hypothetical protein
VLAQLTGALIGVLAAHAMFELPLLQLSVKARSGAAQGFAEWVATFGLVATILLTLRAKPQAVAMSVGLYITAAYWFTASTSFANPAVTLARALSDTFAGIRPNDVPLFIAAQLAGAVCALLLTRWLLSQPSIDSATGSPVATVWSAGCGANAIAIDGTRKATFTFIQQQLPPFVSFCVPTENGMFVPHPGYIP